MIEGIIKNDLTGFGNQKGLTERILILPAESILSSIAYL